ncbi:PRELI-like family-domain-containing protein [Sphaerosporella brunnea]|uniref:PRELI-like family-domain-containing protein n=1 Tax=Sphaerosporella brunnea TaxID=1250544 RepID=A0A5J5EYS5_9PEZI|nr:PRELI-like family-domain-containing protein [Sphaerosporella brunnea]
MVKFFENTFSYDYQWPAVTLAYFLRYPNPYSTHVVSTDTLSTRIDPETGTLHITRLHLKRGKLPASVARFIPKIKESYILEKSIVDARNQTLKTENRNLDWDGVLSVVENQVYAPSGPDTTDVKTVVRFESKFGRRAEVTEKRGWLGGWGAGSVQRSIELVGRSRMRDGLQRSREGMKIVLEQLRERGFVGVVKEQRQGQWERWKKVWRGEGKVQEES